MMPFIFTLFTVLLLGACGREVAKTTSTKTVTPIQSSPQCIGEVAGRNFQADDGCNTCSCNASGQMMCTEMMCSGTDGF